MGNQQRLTPEERITISELLPRYLKARNVSYAELARATGLSEKSKSLYSRAVRGEGLSAEQGLAVHQVLRFGVIEPGDPPELRPEDRDAWLQATHASELLELATEMEIEESAARLLHRVRGWWAFPTYAHTWGGARWRELRLDFVQAEPPLQKAVLEAVLSEAPEELLGIMRQDLTEAYLARGKLAEARAECARAEQLFDILRRQRDTDTAQLGLGRAKAQWLQIAAWEGRDQATCRALGEEALALMRPIKDHYGACKVHIVLAYVDLIDDDLRSAHTELMAAKEQAQQIRKPPWNEPYWLIRDGLFLGSQWMALHVHALWADLQAALASAAGAQLSEDQLALPEQALRARWWAPMLPPLYPFYFWRFEQSTRSAGALKRILERRIQRMLTGGLVMYAPHAMVSYGDFLLEVDGDIDAARGWFRQAWGLADAHELRRLQRMAEGRLQQAESVIRGVGSYPLDAGAVPILSGPAPSTRDLRTHQTHRATQPSPADRPPYDRLEIG